MSFSIASASVSSVQFITGSNLDILKWIAIIGASIVVAIIVLAKLGLIFLKWKLNKWMASLGEGITGLAGAMSSLPGFRLKLKSVSEDEFEWHHPDDAAGMVRELQSCGFVEDGLLLRMIHRTCGWQALCIHRNTCWRRFTIRKPAA